MILSRFSVEQLVALNEHNEGVRRARREYRLHPFANMGHGRACAAEGCIHGIEMVKARSSR